jgi:hypothetical protein
MIASGTKTQKVDYFFLKQTKACVQPVIFQQPGISGTGHARTCSFQSMHSACAFGPAFK